MIRRNSVGPLSEFTSVSRIWVPSQSSSLDRWGAFNGGKFVELDGFLADPVGRYLVGHRWVCWCARPDLFGIVMWGRLDADSARALFRAWVVEFTCACRTQA
jgi:hypothetical protein